ncbi:MAG: hypothetical protein HQL64_08920 [Magnetococcales bacterium]|nr:hypothetical protein [Magnetococcales bacterium]
MNENRAVKLAQGIDAQPWQTSFHRPDIKRINETFLPGLYVEGEARVRLISKTGFEQKYIFTSLIATG